MERKIFSIDEKKSILKKTSCKCGHCGKKLTLKTMTIDHIYPIYKGGDNSEYNVIALCEQCNKEKSNFVYEFTSYYLYCNDIYVNDYENNLNKKIYIDDYVLGNCISIIRIICSNCSNKFTQRPLNKTAINMMSLKLSLTRAIESEADAICDFYNTNEKVSNNSDVSFNRNKYVIQNIINHSPVYILQDSKLNIQGVLQFTNIKDIVLENPNILSIMENKITRYLSYISPLQKPIKLTYLLSSFQMKNTYDSINVRNIFDTLLTPMLDAYMLYTGNGVALNLYESTYGYIHDSLRTDQYYVSKVFYNESTFGFNHMNFLTTSKNDLSI